MPHPQQLKRINNQIIVEQQSPPPKNPFPLPHPPQNKRIRIRNKQLLLFPPSQPHPQFVAAKSLMLLSPKLLFTLNNMIKGMSCLQIILN